jgi:transcription antitermination factor NusG
MNNRSRRQSQRRSEINRISSQIDQLSTQLNKLLIAEAEEQQQEQRPRRNQNEIKEGDKVEITNNHRGLQGARGTVISVTPKQVSLQLETNKNIVYRSKTNVRRIHN